jgi:hypothetical protein
MRFRTLLFAATLLPLFAQEPNLPPNLEALSSRADESVKVTLDGALLQLAAKMIPDDDDQHTAALRKVLAGIQGIYVRSFEFGGEGEYTAADLDSMKALFHDPSWSRIVSVKTKSDGDCDVYIRGAAEGKFVGVGVVAADPRELTLVRIVGEITPEQLVELGGEFHIPRLELGGHSERKDRK